MNRFFIQRFQNAQIPPPPRRKLHLEALEDRTAPAVDFWTNVTGDGLWKTAGNWSTGNPPLANDTATFDSTKSNTSATFDTDVTVKAINQLVFQNNYAGTLTLTSGTLSLANGMVHKSNANLAGAGSIELFGADSNWQNTGTLGISLLHLTVNSSMTIAGAMNLNGTSFANDGTLNWKSNTIKTTAGGLVLNRALSVFRMNPLGVNGLLFDSDLNVNTINLSMLAGSTLTVSGGNNEIHANFFMAGTVNVASSQLTVSFASESSGTYNLSDGSALYVSPPTVGSAIAQFDAGAKVLDVGTGNVPSNTYIQQGLCTIASGSVQIDNLSVNALGTLNGSGTLNVAKSFKLFGAIFVANTNLLANSSDQLGSQMPNGNYVTIGGNFTNAGNLTWYGKIDIAAGAQVVNNGLWTANFQSPFLTDYSQGGTKGTFTNNGTFTVAASVTPTVQIPFTNAGTFNVYGSIGFVLDVTQSAGIITVSGGANLSTGARLLINGGIVTGWGSITTTNGVFNSGTISVGSNLGTLTINGDLTENVNGTISIILDPAATGGMSNKLTVSGKLKKNGNLQVTWKNSTPPGAAATFSILTYGSTDTGTFTESDPAGTNIVYGATTATLFFSP